LNEVFIYRGATGCCIVSLLILEGARLCVDCVLVVCIGCAIVCFSGILYKFCKEI